MAFKKDIAANTLTFSALNAKVKAGGTTATFSVADNLSIFGASDTSSPISIDSANEYETLTIGTVGATSRGYVVYSGSRVGDITSTDLDDMYEYNPGTWSIHEWYEQHLGSIYKQMRLKVLRNGSDVTTSSGTAYGTWVQLEVGGQNFTRASSSHNSTGDYMYWNSTVYNYAFSETTDTKQVVRIKH